MNRTMNDGGRRLILASGSPARRTLLENADLTFDVCPADIDERSIEADHLAAGKSPAEIAMLLADAKAGHVSRQFPNALVIASDQTLGLGGERMTKPADREAARRQIMKLAGRTHQLSSAVACAEADRITWRHLSTAELTMRDLSANDIDNYLDAAGDAVLSSVGCYQLEGRGLTLFEEVRGDYFTILGLPMLPLLAFLRKTGVRI